MFDETTGSVRFLEKFESLNQVPNLVHGFILRNPEIDVNVDRDEALDRLQPHYDTILAEMGIDRASFWTGEQIHHDHIEICSEGPSLHFPDTDGLVTAEAGQFLGIFVADCGAIYLVDPVRRVCGLVHSGKKGSELGIAVQALETMKSKFGTDPGDVIVQVSPCIRPPAYEVDFAAQVRSDCREAGIPENQIFDNESCTSQDLEKYYSYRAESGKTGRMLAVLGFKA